MPENNNNRSSPVYRWRLQRKSWARVAGPLSCGTWHPAKKWKRRAAHPSRPIIGWNSKPSCRGLGALKRPCRVELFTDSVYVGKGISEWMANWKANGWKRKEKNKLVPLKNDDLWKQLDELVSKHRVKYTRVAGHSGHPENDRVDELAVAAYQKYL